MATLRGSRYALFFFCLFRVTTQMHQNFVTSIHIVEDTIVFTCVYLQVIPFRVREWFLVYVNNNTFTVEQILQQNISTQSNLGFTDG
ncbi:hypothetical protein D3C71_1790100 [compost metagenome]